MYHVRKVLTRNPGMLVLIPKESGRGNVVLSVRRALS